MLKSRTLFAVKISAIFLLAYLFTISRVYESELKGRLDSVPNYDDVTYFLSGVDLAQALHDKGAYGWGDHIERFGAHAPYSEFVAGLAIYFNGYSPKAIYTADVFLVFTYLCCLGYFFKSLNLYLQFALFACFLTLPFVTMSVVEFRPDLAWAVLLGFAVIFLITRRDYFQTLMPSVIFGLFVSLALLTKPSTFAMTILLSGLAFSERIGLEFFQPKRPTLRDIAVQAALRILVVLGTIGFITGPYIYYFGRITWAYFWDNTFGKNADIWVYKGSDTWTFYIYGGAYECNMYYGGLILIIGAVLTLLPYFVRHLRLYNVFEFLGCLALILVAYVINSSAPVKSPFLGGAFYGTLIFTMAHVFGRYLSTSSNPSNTPASTPSNQKETAPASNRGNLFPFPECFVTVLLFLCLIMYHWPSYSYVDPAHGLYMRDLHEKLYDYFEHTPSPATISLTQANPLVEEDIGIYYMLHHQHPVINSAAISHTLDESLSIIKDKELVITQNSHFQGTTDWLPCEKWQDQIVSRLSQDPDYHLDFTYPDPAGKSLYVFRRTTKAATP